MSKIHFLNVTQANCFTNSHARAVQQHTSVRPLEADRMKEHSRRHLKKDEERTKLERSSAIALHVLETEHHVECNNPEVLFKHWSIYSDRINAEQWFISHQPEACNLKGATIHLARNLIEV